LIALYQKLQETSGNKEGNCKDSLTFAFSFRLAVASEYGAKKNS